jgi:GH25 family lysozyme M1 (1,4-beta-N-acetylmuramidase)
MATPLLATCEYCGTKQEAGQVWSCVKCGAPYRIVEPIQTIATKVKTAPLPSAALTDYGWPVIDISKWQGDVNWDILATSPPVVTIIKSSQATWRDEQYWTNYNEAITHRKSFGIYHYLDPRYKIDEAARLFAGQINETKNIWRVKRLVDPFTAVTVYGSKFRAWLDVESNQGPNNTILNPDKMLDAISDFCEIVYAMTGLQLGIYTRASFWDVCVERSNNFVRNPLWVAHYNDEINRPAIPQDWLQAGKRETLWQYTDKGPGKEWGMQSYSLDMNRFNGSQVELMTWAWQDYPPPPTEPPSEFTVTVNTQTLNLRSEPTDAGGSATVIGTSTRGKKFNVIGQEVDSQGRVWYRAEVYLASWLTKK